MITPVQTGAQPGNIQQGRIQEVPAGAERAQRVGRVDAQTQANAAIIETTLQVSITARNETMRLLLQSVSVNLNEALKPYLGESAAPEPPAAPVDSAAAGGTVDYSPEATAERIFSLSTGFYEAFKAQHPGEDANATLTHFLDVIRGGIEQGFKEARDVLEGLSVLQGDIAANIDQTYSLVQDKLDAWLKQMQDGLAAPAADSTAVPAPE